MAKTVLVVDDYADTRELMRFMIERQGYEVIEAGNGLEATELAQKERPDLIFMDLAMPVMDGFIAAKRIRSLFDPVIMPIIAFTASGTSIRSEALRAGYNDIIFKPVEPSSLYPILQNISKVNEVRTKVSFFIEKLCRKLFTAFFLFRKSPL